MAGPRAKRARDDAHAAPSGKRSARTAEHAGAHGDERRVQKFLKKLAGVLKETTNAQDLTVSGYAQPVRRLGLPSVAAPAPDNCAPTQPDEPQDDTVADALARAVDSLDDRLPIKASLAENLAESAAALGKLLGVAPKPRSARKVCRWFGYTMSVAIILQQARACSALLWSFPAQEPKAVQAQAATRTAADAGLSAKDAGLLIDAEYDAALRSLSSAGTGTSARGSARAVATARCPPPAAALRAAAGLPHAGPAFSSAAAHASEATRLCAAAAGPAALAAVVAGADDEALDASVGGKRSDPMSSAKP